MILVSPYSRNKNLFDAFAYPETFIRSCPPVGKANNGFDKK